MTAGPSPLLQGAALLLATTAVAAQTAAPTEDAPATLEAVTVTAQKRAERLQDVPTAVSAVNGKSIEDTELRTTKDLAREIPGATGWNAESRARPRFFLRGIGSNEATNNAVQPIGVYADEVYLLNSMFLGGPLFDLDRVEVLRGPQGTLWGKNTTGGAYHFVSRKPTFTPEGYAKVGFGNYGQRLIEGAYGGPVHEDVLAQRISLHYETRDGWATNRQTGRSIGDLTDIAARYQLRANLTPDLRANLNVHVRQFNGTQTPAYPVTRPGVPTFGYTSPYVTTGNRGSVDYNGGDPATKVSTSGVTANLEWDVAGLTLTSITAVDVGTREAAPQDSDWTPVEVSRSYSRNQARQLSQEVRLASPRTDRLNWIAGAYYFKDRNSSYSATATTLPVSTNPGLTYAQYQQETESKALFGSVTYNLTDRFALTGGLRYTAERVAIDLDSLGSVATVNGTVPFGSNAWWLVGQANTPLTTIATQDEDRTWHNLGFDLTPQYKFSEHQLAYARVASGYRSGNYAGGNTLSGPPSVVQPEKLRAYEVGYKSDWLDRRVVFNAAAYYYDYQDMQLTVNRVVNGQFASVLANAGQGKVTGIEFETRALVARGLTLRANASALRTKFTELTTGNVDYAGYNFARVPRVTGLLGADYALPLGSGALLLGTDWSYNSQVNFNVTNNTDAYALQKGFWLGTLRAGYAFAGGKTVLNAYVNNVTNQQYKIQAMLYSNARYNTTLGDPRTVGLTLTTRFF